MFQYQLNMTHNEKELFEALRQAQSEQDENHPKGQPLKPAKYTETNQKELFAKYMATQITIKRRKTLKQYKGQGDAGDFSRHDSLE